MDETIERFVKAQELDYATALSEVRAGEKQSHWMWYIFPQVRGLGMSEMAEFYGIKDLAEAKAYLAHPVLGPHIREISEAVMTFAEKKSARRIFGEIDRLKLKSSMTLFDWVEPNTVFGRVLDAFFYGKRDKETYRLLGLDMAQFEKSDEEKAEIAYLDQLRATDPADVPGIPFVAIVKVKEVVRIPKNGDQYDLATVSDGRMDWRVIVNRGVWEKGDRGLFVSAGAGMRVDERFNVGRMVKPGIRKFVLGDGEAVRVYEPLVRRVVFRGNPGVMFKADDFKELKWKRAGAIDPSVLGICDASELEKKRLERLEAIRVRERENRKAKEKRQKKARMEEARKPDLETYADEGRAPEFVTVTKLEKIQNLPELFEQYTDCRFEVSEKMMGVNISVYCRHGDVNHPIHICRDGVEVAPLDSNYYWQLIRRYEVDKALLSCQDDYLVEGVCVGPGIRDGQRYGLRANEFLAFDVYNISEDYTLSMAERVAFCKQLKLLHVPMVKTSDAVFARCRTLKEIFAEAGGRNYYRAERHGLVYRSLEPDLDVWFEVINPRAVNLKKEAQEA